MAYRRGERVKKKHYPFSFFHRLRQFGLQLSLHVPLPSTPLVTCLAFLIGYGLRQRLVFPLRVVGVWLLTIEKTTPA